MSGPVRWGMLSTAGIGRVVASAIRGSSEAEFVAVAGRDAGKAAAYAAELGVPRSVPGLLKLRDAVDDTVGANFDPSHLLWMGPDPIAAIAALAGAIHHVHAKDTRIESRAAVASRLETIPNERTNERAWNYVAVGSGHPGGVAFWTRFVSALHAAGYDGPFENEDYTLGQRESVALAVATLRQALADPVRTQAR
jgi:sugar phosphate isomerase/epimerase